MTRTSAADYRVARIVDPIIDGFSSGEHVWGQLLNDYRPTDW